MAAAGDRVEPEMPEPWLNSAAGLEPDPELGAQMNDFKTRFQKCELLRRPVTPGCQR
jgi:hypothetical protein